MPSSPGSPALGQEYVDPSEADVIDTMQTFIEMVLERQYPEGVRPFRRDAHPKLHGLVRAEFSVLPDVPEPFRYGLFERARSYDAWIRFSSATGPVRSDEQPDAQGMAIKLLDVPGQASTTHDLVMVNYPTFNASTPKQFLSLLGPQKAKTLEENPLLAAAERAVYAQMVANPLQIRYWSMTPYTLGSGAMKFSARRVNSPLDARPVLVRPDFLREAMVQELAARDVTFDFLVQVQVDAEKMPVEDALVDWSEAISPFVRVATIRIPRQAFDGEAQRSYGDELSFSPWNALDAQRPIGGINRARRQIYEAISALRHRKNGSEAVEPTSLRDFA